MFTTAKNIAKTLLKPEIFSSVLAIFFHRCEHRRCEHLKYKCQAILAKN